MSALPTLPFGEVNVFKATIANRGAALWVRGPTWYFVRERLVSCFGADLQELVMVPDALVPAKAQIQELR